MPAAGQPGEVRWGKACPASARVGRVWTAHHQLGVSRRPSSCTVCLPECSWPSLAPSGPFLEEPAWFKASWSRRTRRPLLAPQTSQSSPYKMCQCTHARIARPNPWGWSDSQLCAVLGLLLGGGQVKQCVDKVQSRVVRGTRRRNARSVLHKTRTKDWNRQKRLNVIISVSPVTAALAFSPVGNNNIAFSKLIA